MTAYMSYAKPIELAVVEYIATLPYYDPKHVDSSGTSALNEAMWNKASLKVVERMIWFGADVNHVTAAGDTVLGTYLYWNDPYDPDFVVSLLKAGFNPSLLSKSDLDLITPVLIQHQAEPSKSNSQNNQKI